MNGQHLMSSQIEKISTAVFHSHVLLPGFDAVLTDSRRQLVLCLFNGPLLNSSTHLAKPIADFSISTWVFLYNSERTFW